MNRIRSLLDKNKNLRQFLRYAAVGTVSFWGEYLIFNIIYTHVGDNRYNIGSFAFGGALIANSVSLFLAFWFCFVLNRRWSFNSKGNVFRQLAYYSALFTVNFFVSNTIVHKLEVRFLINPRISKLLAMCVIVCWNFVAYKYIIYKE